MDAVGSDSLSNQTCVLTTSAPINTLICYESICPSKASKFPQVTRTGLATPGCSLFSVPTTSQGDRRRQGGKKKKSCLSKTMSKYIYFRHVLQLDFSLDYTVSGNDFRSSTVSLKVIHRLVSSFFFQ